MMLEYNLSIIYDCNEFFCTVENFINFIYSVGEEITDPDHEACGHVLSKAERYRWSLVTLCITYT